MLTIPASNNSAADFYDKTKQFPILTPVSRGNYIPVRPSLLKKCVLLINKLKK